MAGRSPSTFDPRNAYTSVRLQAEVPIVDADWNEAEDIRKEERAAILAGIVGTSESLADRFDVFLGLGWLPVRRPYGENSFFLLRNTLTGPDDFLVADGASSVDGGLRDRRRVVIGGWEIQIAGGVRYKEQLLHEDNPGAQAESERLQVAKIPRIPIPPIGMQITYSVVLDVWERLVTPNEAPTLTRAGGVETCARIKREWVVRAFSQVSTGHRGQEEVIEAFMRSPMPPPGHRYGFLGFVERMAGATDFRIQLTSMNNLLSLPATTIPDLFGVSASEYQRGRRQLLPLRRPVELLSENSPLRSALAFRALDQPTIERIIPLNDKLPFHRLVAVTDTDHWVWPIANSGGQSHRILRADASDPQSHFLLTTKESPLTRSDEPPTQRVYPPIPLPGGRLAVAYRNQGSDQTLRVKIARWEQLQNAPSLAIENGNGSLTDELYGFVRNGRLELLYPYQRTAGYEILHASIDLRATPLLAPGPPAVVLRGPGPQGRRPFTACQNAAGEIWVAFYAPGNPGSINIQQLGATMQPRVLVASLGDTQDFLLTTDSKDRVLLFFGEQSTINYVQISPNFSSTRTTLHDLGAGLSVAMGPNGQLHALAANTRQIQLGGDIWTAGTPFADRSPSPALVAGSQGIYWRIVVTPNETVTFSYGLLLLGI